MTRLRYLPILLIFGCPKAPPTVRPAPIHDDLRADAATCTGAEIAWTPGARAGAADLISFGLAQRFDDDELGLDGLAAPGFPVVVVIVPDDLVVGLGPHQVRARTPPTPGPREVEYWRIEARTRFTDGVLFVREQGTVFPDGRVARAVAYVCGAYVDGEPTLDRLSSWST